MRMSAKNKNHAFTLIEIMTVAAIMGIMVLAVSPAVSSANRNSKASKCSANLRIIQSAKAAYLMENVGKLEIDRSDAQSLDTFRQYFPQQVIPEGCPSMDSPIAAPYQDVYHLYKDVYCTNNCPAGSPIASYPYEPDIGGPNYYRNGYHDLHRRE